MALITPNWSCSIQVHILADTTVGMAHGTSTAARSSAFSGDGWFSISAMPRPNSVSSDTDSSANHRVLRTAPHHCGSFSTPVSPR